VIWNWHFLTLPPKLDERLQYVTIWEDPLVFVAAPFHPLAQMQNLQLEDLIQYPSLLPASQNLYQPNHLGRV
jgi:DNA-binding transcriptional LysR family regulator